MKHRIITSAFAPLLAVFLVGAAAGPGVAQAPEFLDPGKVVEGTTDSSGKAGTKNT